MNEASNLKKTGKMCAFQSQNIEPSSPMISVEKDSGKMMIALKRKKFLWSLVAVISVLFYVYCHIDTGENK